MPVKSNQFLLALRDCAQRARTARLTLGETLDTLHEATFCFVLLVLALPFLQPFSPGPYTAVGGSCFLALGWQMMCGRDTPWLPKQVRELSLGPKTWRFLLTMCEWTFVAFRKITRPRLQSWVTGLRGRRICGAFVVLGALLLLVPALGLPFNNTLPALIVVSVCIGELEEDGAMLFVAAFWVLATLAYFAATFFVGLAALRALWTWWFGNSP
jgi:hypothetical protein